ncbi:MAG: ABC transporter ATP-binding protein [Chloroflexota bacterium]|nr:ABC transporter ATP-binding protein [Chloroflexota bacterium]
MTPSYSHDLNALAWDAARLGEAIELLARKARLLPHPVQLPAPDETREAAATDSAALGQWVNHLASQLGIEAEPVDSTYADADPFVHRSAPAILRLPQDVIASEAKQSPTRDVETLAPHASAGVASSQKPLLAMTNPRFLALWKSNNARVVLLAPDASSHRVPPHVIRRALCAPIEAPRRAMIGELLDRAGVAPEQRERVGATILAEQLSGARLEGGWLLRLSPAASIWQHARQARLLQPLLAIVGADLIRQILLLVAWAVVGRSVFVANFDAAWLWAWALLVFSGIPFQLLMTRAQGQFATGLSGIYKTRLLYGTLKLSPDEIRHQGVGQFLGRVLETEAIELFAVSGGLTALVAVIDLVIAGAVLAVGIGGWPHALLLGLWVLLTLLLGWNYGRTNRAWVAIYRGMTNDLVERMVGHRTRLAQEDPASWHADEDRELDRYLHLSERVDRAGVLLAAMPRGWMVIGLAEIALMLIAAERGASIVAVAISLGGVLLALQALTSVIAGVQNVVAVTQAWDQVAPLFNAATRREEIASVVLPAQAVSADEPEQQPLLTAKEISFRYREHGQPVLNRCNLQVNRGDRLLLEGPSGGGKTSLAAVLSGLRAPESGLLLLWGYDRGSLGAEVWRQRIAVAPQFHENHVFTETFAFNLLMGRRWPPTETDLQEAEEICRELGLGDLIKRMPAGLQQMVGESGWQLSHGERSRLYIARALLQHADLMILDESFAALDPETLALSLRCVLRRAPTLMVIAHP